MRRDNARFISEKDGSGIGAVQNRILGGVTLLVTAVIVAANRQSDCRVNNGSRMNAGSMPGGRFAEHPWVNSRNPQRRL
jgi:hypothetical protein